MQKQYNDTPFLKYDFFFHDSELHTLTLIPSQVANPEIKYFHNVHHLLNQLITKYLAHPDKYISYLASLNIRSTARMSEHEKITEIKRTLKKESPPYYTLWSRKVNLDRLSHLKPLEKYRKIYNLIKH